MGNSHITSMMLPTSMRSKLESCMSAKLLFNPLGSATTSSATPSLADGLFGLSGNRETERERERDGERERREREERERDGEGDRE